MVLYAGPNESGRGFREVADQRGRSVLLVEEADLLQKLSVDGIFPVADVNHAIQARVLKKRNVNVHGVIFRDLGKNIKEECREK